MSKFNSIKLPRQVVITLVFAAILTAFIMYLAVSSSSSGNTNGRNIFKAGKEDSSSPFAGEKFYVDPASNAARQAEEWSTTRGADSKQMARLATLPAARWVGDTEDFEALASYYSAIESAGGVAVSVLYNIPGRDCGLYSAGGVKDAAAYREFIDKFVGASGNIRQIVIIEPDALAQLEEKNDAGKPCLANKERTQRTELLAYAVERIGTLPQSFAYLDAGNSAWDIEPGQMADRLKASKVDKAAGFSLNVSNFRKNDETVSYGRKISAQLGGAHYVIDTSRNGLGPYENKARPDYGWCNPPGRALGHYPTFDTGITYVDAFLYVKGIGESDGTDPDPQKCFNGPAAGEWSPEYALGLMQRWPSYLQPPSLRER